MTTDPLDMTLTEKIALIRSSLTPLDLADMLELEVKHDKIISPYNPDEHTASCHLYEDGWFDYSTGQHGDVIDLFCKLSGKTVGQAVNRLLEGAQRLDAEPDRVRRVAVEPPDLTDEWGRWERSCGLYFDRWVESLPPLDAYQLGVLEGTDSIRWINSGTQMAIAHRHDDVVRGIKLRTLQGVKSAVPGSTFACGLYQPFPWKYDQAIITEGETDCWALAATSIEADILSLPSGAGVWKDAWLTQLERYDRVYTAFDNDAAGKRATDKVAAAVTHWKWLPLQVPQLYNDVREALAAGWRPKLRSRG